MDKGNSMMTTLISSTVATKIWMLNPEKDAIIENAINCLAVLLSHGNMNILIHAFQDPRFYDRFTTRCSIILSLDDNDAFVHADCLMKEIGIVSQNWNWKEGDFLYRGGIAVDAQELLFQSASSKSGNARDNTIYLYQSLDTLQIAGTSEVIAELMD